MSAPKEERTGWTIQEAEQLLTALVGVVSARIVARPGGEVDEIHLLTTEEVSAKQTVRNVESALLAHLDLSVDHRKISVAQTQAGASKVEAAASSVQIAPEPSESGRLLFQSHQMESERSHQVRHRVEIEWNGGRFEGEATSVDLPRSRLEAVARATLTALEMAVARETTDEMQFRRPVTLSLDGVKVVEAFDRSFVMVAVHAMAGRDTTALAGATQVDESADRATILATLQATDRWVRGKS